MTALKSFASMLRLSVVSTSTLLISRYSFTQEEERNIKAVIRGIPVDFAIDDIKNDLCGQGIRVEAPHRKGGEWTRTAPRALTKKYGQAAANCYADPRCVKCLVSHWTKECPLTRESEGKPFCVNCGQHNMANNKECPKAPKFLTRIKLNPKRPFRAPVAPPRDLENFPALATKKTTPVANFSSAPAPSTNPWGESTPKGRTGAVQRAPPVPPSESTTAGPSSFGNDIQTVMAVLRAVKSS
ncbi:hypothetical protein EVAR_28599_1 [Eumeta japonica]|uniref:Nucleic-acid-binding protein from transposon X-element n=1 Tax=Eumeta variegata TaxID=151549 RepID=A0A4C1UY65_EUMVA|nr:hypothetical protein EVAR_28599_1 [Eumeta japonica]